ncbi:bifunctional (p)ppGpp synthetase/guanosine-3',5'-bis(diphosphate) 3'-pyrophosphohydrolase, partial [Candidatus Parcubacteria bacterium]|nr:bifunctional (p)ppGpp synthetase/guanosine-3',5'-bis(diphosphate) 3'-pyrophosphohydrolase [Candidatus Parcubacteria bacterium]
FDLPKNATPVDFAYAIHTDVGNHTTGALINDKMAVLDQELKNGDLVEIIIDKKRKGPNRDWLKFIKTNKARNKIKQYSKESRLEGIRKLIPKI